MANKKNPIDNLKGHVGRGGETKHAPATLLERFEPMQDLADYQSFLRAQIKQAEADLIHEQLNGGRNNSAGDIGVQLMDLWEALAKISHNVMPYKHPKLAAHQVKAAHVHTSVDPDEPVSGTAQWITDIIGD